jgi:GT2 family glycosyltransferase
MTRPTVTIVVVPHEQFSKAQVSLESIFAHTKPPFSLIYVDGKSPPRIRRYLELQAEIKNFRLIQLEHYPPANQARNLALNYVTTKYVVFIDNDVLVSPDWLDPLVGCAEETGAWIVGPLYCMDDPKDLIIHTAGAEYRIVESDGKRRLHGGNFLVGQRVPDVREQLGRRRVNLVEFHCLLARTEALRQLGMLDERLLSYLDHCDVCLMTEKAGGTVFIETQSIVTYLRPPPFSWSDLPLFLLRWSNRWLFPSLDYFSEKHRIDEDDPHFRDHMEYQQQQRQRLFRHPRATIRWLLGDPVLQRLEHALDRVCDRIVVAKVAIGSHGAQDRPSSRVERAMRSRSRRLAEIARASKERLLLRLNQTGHLRRVWRDEAARDVKPDTAERMFIKGFSFPEAEGRWTDGKLSVMEVPVDAPLDAVVRVRLVVRPFIPPGVSKFAFATATGMDPVGRHVLTTQGGSPVEVILATRAVGSGKRRAVIALGLTDAKCPTALGLSDDPRVLGLFVERVEALRSESIASNVEPQL